VNAPPDYNSDQLFKSNLTFCMFLIGSLKSQSVLRREVDQLFKSNVTFCVVLRCEWFIHNRLFNANFDAKFKKKTPFILGEKCMKFSGFSDKKIKKFHDSIRKVQVILTSTGLIEPSQ
jgi:hypothetical protein